MESVGFGEKFDERRHGKGGGKVEWKILSLGNCVVCGAMETGKTEAQMVTEVLVIYWR